MTGIAMTSACNRARLRMTALVSITLSMTALVPEPAAAQMVVFDPNNYAQNVMTAARELQQINNQIQSLTNQAQMLVNQAKNLANLPMSTLAQLQSTITKTQSLLAQAQRISFDVQQVQTAYSSSYGAAPTSASNSTLFAAAQTRWQNSVAAFEDSLKVQAGVVGNMSTHSSATTSLVSASQSASGALQAAQAGNQILAVQSQQLSDLAAVLAAKARADALEQARVTAAESQGQQQYKNFSIRIGYQPGTVTMFSGN